MVKIYIFRTGTVDTDEKIFLGWKNVPLSKKGLDEAKVIEKKLKNTKIDYAFCSDQLRGKQTLAEVLKNHKKSKVIIDPRLREKNYGIYTGVSKSIFQKYCPNTYVEIKKGRDYPIPNGETLQMVGVRVFSFLNDVFKLVGNQEKVIVICTHTNPMRLMQEYFENLEYYKTTALEHDPTMILAYEVKFKE